MSALPEPILLPYFKIFNDNNWNYLNLNPYPNTYLDTEKGFISLKALYHCLMKQVPLSFENRGFTGRSPLIKNTDSFSSWFHFKPKAEGNRIAYSWNDLTAPYGGNEQVFLRLSPEQNLLQAIRGEDRDFVGLVKSGKSHLLFAGADNKTQFMLAPDCLSHILKTQRVYGGWIIHGILDNLRIFLSDNYQEAPVHYWFFGLGKGGIVYMGSDYCTNPYQYPEYLNFRQYISKYGLYEVKFPSNMPVRCNAYWEASYQDMSLITIHLYEPFSGETEVMKIAAHNDLSNEYLEKIGKLVAENIPSSMIQSLRNTYGV